MSDSPLAEQLGDLQRRRSIYTAPAPALPKRTRVMSVSNQKGGVGKTTTTVNFAAALAHAGARVLVIDLDPQGNASTALGIDHHGDIPGIYEVLIGEASLRDVLKPSTEPGELYCVPSTIHLAGAEIDIIEMERREFLLRTALEQLLSDPSNGFHYVFIDCPPSLGLLTVNAFVAAQEVLLPIQCEYYALEGVSQLLRTVDLVTKHLNPNLRVGAVLLTMYDGRTRLSSQVVQEVREHFGDVVLPTVIPRSVRLSEAPSYGQTVLAYDAGSSGALAYVQAARDLNGAAHE